MNLNSERESHVLETLDRDLSRKNNFNRLICAHLNINSVRSKFNLLSDIIKNNVDILMISEPELDSSFPNEQFQFHGYSEPYRLDRNGNGGGILVFIRENIPTKPNDSQMKIERYFIELNLRRKKWFLCCSYNPKYSQILHHLKEICKDLAALLSKYDNIILMGDFNAEPAGTIISDFCEIYNLKNIIMEKTCFKNPNNPNRIDLIISNRSKSFQNYMVIETGLSDFPKMSITVMKMYYSKQKPTIIHYRKLKDFQNDSFIKDLQTVLTKSFNEEAIPFQALRESVNVTLEKHAPTK